jgi:ABC-type multidrug transport system fused ATPase/permease subunit
MSSEKRHKDKSNKHFWRAIWFLWPYRKYVVVSIVCAVFVSGAFAGGLGTMLPIMRVFLNGDTVQSWVDRTIAQRRLGVTFADRVDELQIIRIQSGGVADASGLQDHDIVSMPKSTATTTLHQLADSSNREIRVNALRTGAELPVSVNLAPNSWRWEMLRRFGGIFPQDEVRAIAMILALLVVLAIVSNVVSFFQEYLSDKAAVLAVNDIRRRLYDHVLHVPLSHYSLKGTSDVTSRLTQDAQNLNEGFKSVLGQSIQEPIKVFVALGAALLMSWKLTIFIIFFTPIMLVIIRKFGKKMRRTSKKAMLNSATMLGQIEGSLMGIRVVKGASAERFERRRYSRIMGKLVEQQLRMSRIDAFTEPTMATLTLVVFSILILVASYMVFKSQTLGRDHFVFVMACFAAIGDSLRRVSKVNNVLQRSNAAAARIFEVLDLPIERGRRDGGNGRQPQGAPLLPQPTLSGAAADVEVIEPLAVPRIKLGPIQRDITFEDITFSYPSASGPALREVNLTVPKGKCVAVVGRNGSGKTTLLALLPRFYDPQRGRVLIDGIDIRHATLRSLRGQISIVTQDSVIFPGTIAQNIAYGHPLTQFGEKMPDDVREQVIEAAKQAYAHDFILDKPQGYETMLGELGGQLSGGQKQRLCIARAIFRKAPILVLDEATSQVDAESEELIQKAIEGLIHERTTFVIAHRISTIRSADEIIVMDRGMIVGQGRHEELLATNETYQQLVERQLFAMPVNQ